MNRYAFSALCLATGIAIGAIMPFSQLDKRSSIDPGATVFDVQEESIMQISLVTTGRTVTAQRSTAGAPFAVQVTFADGRAAQQCLVAPNLAGRLHPFSRLVAERQIELSDLDSEFPILLGILDIRTAVLTEPMAPLVVRIDRKRTAVAVAYDGFAARLTMPVNALDELGLGCKGLTGL